MAPGGTVATLMDRALEPVFRPDRPCRYWIPFQPRPEPPPRRTVIPSRSSTSPGLIEPEDSVSAIGASSENPRKRDPGQYTAGYNRETDVGVPSVGLRSA